MSGFLRPNVCVAKLQLFFFVFLLRHRLGGPDADTNRIDRGVDREDWDVGRCEVEEKDRSKSYYVGSWALGFIVLGEQGGENFKYLALMGRWANSIYSNATVRHRVLISSVLSCCILFRPHFDEANPPAVARRELRS